MLFSYHCFSRNEDFEVIRYMPEKNGFDHVDEFEEMQLKPCDYSVEEPQQKRKTILDDFAAWLQRPASNNTEGRHENKKHEPPSCCKIDRHQGLFQEFSKDGRIALDFSSALDISTDRAVEQNFNPGMTSGDELMIKSDHCKYRPDLNVMEDATEIETNLFDNQAMELTSLYPNVVSMSESLPSMDTVTTEERTSIRRRIGPSRESHESGGVSPVFDPPLNRRNPVISQAKSQLSCSERLNLSDNAMTGKNQNSGDFMADLLPSFQSDLFVSNDSFMSPVHMQDAMSMQEQVNPTNSSLQTPVSGKRDSQKVVQNESPLGTKLTTFRIDSKSSSKASGFQRIELTGDAKNASPILTSNTSDNALDGSVGRNEQHGKSLVADSCREISDEDINAKKTDVVSAGDVLCDDRGEMIYKWSR